MTASVTNPMGVIVGFIFNPHFTAGVATGGRHRRDAAGAGATAAAPQPPAAARPARRHRARSTAPAGRAARLAVWASRAM